MFTFFHVIACVSSLNILVSNILFTQSVKSCWTVAKTV